MYGRRIIPYVLPGMYYPPPTRIYPKWSELKYKYEHEKQISEDEQETLILSIVDQFMITDVAKIVVQYNSKLLNKTFKYPYFHPIYDQLYDNQINNIKLAPMETIKNSGDKLTITLTGELAEDLTSVFIKRAPFSVIKSVAKDKKSKCIYEHWELFSTNLLKVHEQISSLDLNEKYCKKIVLKIIEINPFYIRRYFRYEYLYAKIIKYLLDANKISTSLRIIKYKYFIENNDLFLNPSLAILFINSFDLLDANTARLLANPNGILKLYQLRLYNKIKDSDKLPSVGGILREKIPIAKIRQEFILLDPINYIPYSESEDANVIANYIVNSDISVMKNFINSYAKYPIAKPIAELLDNVFVAYLIEVDYDCSAEYVSDIFRICSYRLAPHVLKLKNMDNTDYKNILSNRELFDW